MYDENFFLYGEKEIEYLRSKDKRLAEVIDTIGHIDRYVDEDLFSSVVHHIIGQQISTKAQQTIWKRMQEARGRRGHTGAERLCTCKKTQEVKYALYQ